MPLFFKDTGSPYHKVVTLTVGGNDAFAIVGPDGSVDPAAVQTMLGSYGANLASILTALTAGQDDIIVYIGNLYDPKLPLPGSSLIIQLVNQVISRVAGGFGSKAAVVDIYSAFLGRSGLLLNEKQGASPMEIHPTDAGHAVMANAFAHAMGTK